MTLEKLAQMAIECDKQFMTLEKMAQMGINRFYSVGFFILQFL